MPMFQTLLGELNVHMGREKIAALAKNKHHFAPGNDPDYSFLMQDHPKLVTAWQGYLKEMPPAMRAGLRAVIHEALSTEPPTQVTFAWAPGYDYEMTVWQAPDTKMTKGGVTVLIKSRYPDDDHPIAGPSVAKSK
ncbi:hypothetical protein [Phenylobacterium sp. J367]|uniref:hypothetical protein n=1 Tax=Phenylobacterium sp. J367 TaxID=2898435 RepID=UPI002151CD00|nr:hypothetical protein [Phenylobacterium sp. J367]MCR5878530.1 hypothetical protein [Phenylobacterium sp. J367]